MISTYSTIIGFFYLFSLASATGHLRLELTSSDSLAVHLQTNISAQTIFLEMGTTRIVSFHPKVDQESLDVTFSQPTGPSQFHVYNLNAAGVKAQQTMVFSDVVLMVQSFFECDDGFIGDTCRETSTTAVTTTTTTTSTTAKATSMTTDGPTTPVVIPESSSTRNPLSSTVSTNTAICITAVVTIVILLMLIVGLALRTRQSHVYIDPTAPSKKCPDDSEDYSPNCSRYTAAPYAEV